METLFERGIMLPAQAVKKRNIQLGKWGRIFILDKEKESGIAPLSLRILVSLVYLVLTEH